MEPHCSLILSLCLVQAGLHGDMTQPGAVEVLVQGRVAQHSPDLVVEIGCLLSEPVGHKDSFEGFNECSITSQAKLNYTI